MTRDQESSSGPAKAIRALLANRRWIGLWVVTGLTTTIALSMPAQRLPSGRLGIREFRSPLLEDGIRLSQTFEMPADGLRGITFRPVASLPDASGSVHLALVDLVQSREHVVRVVEVDVGALTTEPAYRWRFAPILESEGHTYRFDVSSSDTNPARGVALRATKGDPYDRGVMQINGKARWADLAFSVDAPNPRIWRLLVSAQSTTVGVSRGYLLLSALVINWLCIGLVLRAFSRVQV